MITEDVETMIHTDLSKDELVSAALRRGEARLASNGALVTETGKHTGRSPKDRFIVDDATTHNVVDWGAVNQPTDDAHFQQLWSLAESYLNEKEECFVSHLRVGASDTHFLPVKVITETAWHNLFVNNLFIRPEGEYTGGEKAWTLLSVPHMQADPARDACNSNAAVMLNFTERKVLIVGTRYAGEMKKAMFSALNFILPSRDILPMHCAANVDVHGNTTLFFGLSGTGKTTLSADPTCKLIGDDEHGWSDHDVFNFEGGCYAKCIDITHKTEPVIWDAIRHHSIMENVIIDADGKPDFHDSRLTQNTRAVYPREHIELRVPDNRGGLPKAVIFLTCDLYGVLPPVSILTKEQAAYHFLSGYTAKVGSTEIGAAAGVNPAFSACFGAPFLPQAPGVYAELLMKRLEETGATVYLVNTGWTGGAYGEGGTRFNIPTTRRVVHAIQSGELLKGDTHEVSAFNLRVPAHIEGVEDALLDPKQTWRDQAAYQQAEQTLVQQFVENFAQFKVDSVITDAGPAKA